MSGNQSFKRLLGSYLTFMGVATMLLGIYTSFVDRGIIRARDSLFVYTLVYTFGAVLGLVCLGAFVAFGYGIVKSIISPSKSQAFDIFQSASFLFILCGLTLMFDSWKPVWFCYTELIFGLTVFIYGLRLSFYSS